jgi:hypothetical protein
LLGDIGKNWQHPGCAQHQRGDPLRLEAQLCGNGRERDPAFEGVGKKNAHLKRNIADLSVQMHILKEVNLKEVNEKKW